MKSLLEQLKTRRKELGLKQNDMVLRVGMSPQQYQKLEARGNPRLNTLELIAKGLNSELVLIPQEKLAEIKAILSQSVTAQSSSEHSVPDISSDPWANFLGGDAMGSED